MRWEIIPTRRDEWHNRKIPGRNTYLAYVYREMTPGFAALRERPVHPRPDAARRGRRRARRALPQRRPRAAPGGDDAPARRQVQPGVRRRLHGRVHARGRLHRPGRDVHLPVGVHAGLGRRVAVPRPRAQPHAEHVPRPVRRDRDPPEGRQAAGPRLHRVRPPAAAAGHGPGAQLPVPERRAPTPATRRRCARASARTSRSTPSAWTPTSTRSTSTATAGRIQRAPTSTTLRWGRTRSVTARFVEDNPGRWLYHCHVFTHQDAGMAGWYVVDP